MGRARPPVPSDDHAGDLIADPWVPEDGDCATIRLLAVPLAGRPGYLEAWRPSGT